MAYLVLLSAQRGRTAGLLAAAGVALGLLAIGLLAAFGFAQFVQNAPPLYQALRWAGVAFLVYLAWDTWRESREPAVASPDLSAAFMRGLVTNLLNPKAYLFYITVLPGFVQPADNAFAQVQVLTLLYVLVATLVHVALALGAGALQGVLAQPRWRRVIGVIAAIFLLAIAGWVALKT